MFKSNLRIILRCVFIFITAMIIIFIFSQSLLPADESSQESGRVLLFINNILSRIGIGPILTEVFVRKLAHFTEFFALGLSFSFTYWSFGFKPYYYSILAFFSTVFMAVCDELIQLFSPGRSCQITDIILDSSGGMCGVLIFVLIIILINKFNGKKSEIYE